MKALKIVLLVLLGMAVTAVALYCAGTLQSPSVPAVAMDTFDSVRALRACAEDLGAQRDVQQALMEALPETVRAAGCDTLLFNVNGADGLCWPAKRETVMPRLQEERLGGLVTVPYDALETLANACAAQEVRLVAAVDVAALAGKSCAESWTDEAFTTRLQGVVRQLDREYAVSAILLQLDGSTADGKEARAALSGVSRQCTVPFGVEAAVDCGLLCTVETGADFVAARLESVAAGEQAAALAQTCTELTGLPVLWDVLQPDALAAAAYYGAGSGVWPESCVWGTARTAALEPEVLAAVHQLPAAESLEQLAALPVPLIGTQLAVSYPAQDAVIYTADTYVMGTSDPSQPLSINGQPVQNRAAGGVFGQLVSLEQGENLLTLQQGGTVVSLRVTRAVYTGGGGTRQADGTSRLAEGTRVRITSWLCSVLNDPDNEDAIRETAKQGGIGVVNRCTQTVRNGKYTWAYELVTGGWVMAYHCTPVTENVGPWPLADFAVQTSGRDEYITLAQGGTALGYDSWNEAEHLLTVTLANVSAPAESGSVTPASRLIRSVDWQIVPGGVQLRIRTDGAEQLWGYDVTYDDAGNTVLYLKAAPQLDLSGVRPLEGAVILLDAGHGADDHGAEGAAGAIGGPCEKDLNLAVTLATRARLEQMGATVYLTREDDSFPTLDDRSMLSHTLHPDLFLAQHHNSMSLDRDVSGCSGVSAYYFTLPGKQLADCLLGPVTEAAARPDGGSHWNYFYVNRMTYTPSVLLEYGFVINPTEYEACADSTVILREGDATARGILEFFRQRCAASADGTA